MNKDDNLISTLGEALDAAAAHLSYCGYGDSWERECAVAQGLEGKIDAAQAAFEKWQAARKPATTKGAK